MTPDTQTDPRAFTSSVPLRILHMMLDAGRSMTSPELGAALEMPRQQVHSGLRILVALDLIERSAPQPGVPHLWRLRVARVTA